MGGVKKLGFLLRPSWVVLALVVAGFAYLCFTVLAPWQLGKNTQTERRNTLIEQSIDATPVPVESLLDGTRTNRDDEWRRVDATGTYLPEQQVLVRLRSIGGTPAYEVLTPLQLGDGRLVLVNRGYVLPVEGTDAPPVAPAPGGTITVQARLRAPEGSSGRTADATGQSPQVYSINPGEVGQLTGAEYVDGYLQLEENQPGGLGVIALPMLDAGPFLSYGLQWIAFGVMAPLGLAYFVRAELRERRQHKANLAAASRPGPADTRPAASDTAAGGAAPGNDPPKRGSSAPPASAEDVVRAKLADRYGNTR